MTDLVILGAGGLAREVADVAMACEAAGQDVRLLGYLDENEGSHGRELNGFRVLGGLGWLREHPEVLAITGIGSTRARQKVVGSVAEAGARFATLIHPRATVGRRVEVGEGTCITAGCVVTNTIDLRQHVFLNLNATVGHDCVLESFVNVSPGVNVSGNVTLHVGADIGTGAAIILGVKVGAWTIVGAGAVVTKDLPAGVTAVGVPARVLPTR